MQVVFSVQGSTHTWSMPEGEVRHAGWGTIAGRAAAERRARSCGARFFRASERECERECSLTLSRQCEWEQQEATRTRAARRRRSTQARLQVGSGKGGGMGKFPPHLRFGGCGRPPPKAKQKILRGETRPIS